MIGYTMPGSSLGYYAEYLTLAFDRVRIQCVTEANVQDREGVP
jgi:hypothetical protein